MRYRRCRCQHQCRPQWGHDRVGQLFKEAAAEMRACCGRETVGLRSGWSRAGMGHLMKTENRNGPARGTKRWPRETIRCGGPGGVVTSATASPKGRYCG